jgi:hypothetical protein
MAINTYGSYLMHSADGTTYSKLLDIKDYPDMVEPPENLDATTLSDPMRVYIPGIKDTGGSVEFTANYDPADFAAVQALEGTEGYFAIWFGEDNGTPDGSKGKFSFKGYPYASKSGGAVNEVSDMKVGIIPTTEIAFSAS